MPRQQTGNKGTGGGIGLGRIAGIRISLDPSWFIIFALVLLALATGYFPRYYPGQETQTYWIAGLLATLLFFASVLIHELSHSLVAIRAGIQIPEITLFIFGGIARMSQEPTNPRTELRIALAGPLSSFALAIIFRVLQMVMAGLAPTLVVAVFEYLAWINLALGVFNLIPGFPLDGGRIFRAAWWWRTGSLTRATKIASDLGKGFAAALMLLGALQIFAGALINGLWLLFIGIFLRGMSARGYEELIIRQALEGMAVREVMIREVVSVPPDITLTQLIHDYFLHHTFRGYPVVREGQVVGLVSITAVGQIPLEARDTTRVEEVMLPVGDNLVVDGEASLAEALRQLTQEGVGRLLVMDRGRLAGLITKTGLLRFVQLKQILGPDAA